MRNTLKDLSISEVVSGGAKGADALAIRYAVEFNIPYTIFEADWSKHGKKAGMMRNSSIVEYCDTLIAFWDGESKGTADSIKKAQKTFKLLDIINYNNLGLYYG